MCDKMKLVEILKPDFVFEDDRGLLTQITHENYAQVNAVFSKKDAVRGNFHYHKNTKEVFYVISGKIEVELYLDEIREKHLFQKGDMFVISENVRHSFDYKEDSYLVVLYTKRVENKDGTKDLYYE